MIDPDAGTPVDAAGAGAGVTPKARPVAPADVIATLRADRLLPTVSVRRAGEVGPLTAALLAGGVHTVEITTGTGTGTDVATAAIRSVAENGRLLVGAGAVLSADQVDRAVDAGAHFVTSPGFGVAVVRRCRQRGVPVLPGAATATDIQAAADAGLDVVRFFPARELGGARMIRALAEVFTGLRFVPAGGVGAADFAEYLAIPQVLAVAAAWVAAPDLIAGRRWREVTRRAVAATHIAATTRRP